MIPVFLCVLALATVFFFSRRSLGFGLVAVFTVAYAYGLLRANFPTAASHFIFDSAALAFYAGVFSKPSSTYAHARSLTLQPWVALLAAWPTLLLFVPVQDWAVQLVGLRGAIFFLPFLLIGARLEDRDLSTLAMGLAVLNLAEFAIATWEFFNGIQSLYPRNAVTELIYRTNDAGSGFLRIPATFVASAAYGGTMTLTIPFLAGVWAYRPGTLVQRRVLEFALLASAVGVFLSASRSAAVLLFCSATIIAFGLQLKTSHRAMLIACLIGVGWIVAEDPRLQRFQTLADTEMVGQRIGGSVNTSFLDALATYPMGNGLGGGGTSIPYFLMQRAPSIVVIENEYARILLEQGVIGLLIWLAFLFWMLISAFPRGRGQWYLARRMLWTTILAVFLSGVLGLGLLTSIPMTAILLLGSGWLIACNRSEKKKLESVTLPSRTVSGHVVARTGTIRYPIRQTR
jgi:hypothetical protein